MAKIEIDFEDTVDGKWVYVVASAQVEPYDPSVGIMSETLTSIDVIISDEDGNDLPIPDRIREKAEQKLNERLDSDAVF